MPEKYDPYKSYGEKLIGLFVRLLFSGESHSLTDLARMLDCSKQTVLRLINNIRKSYGIEIEETKQGNRSFYRINKSASSLQNVPLTEAELQSLQLCKAFTQHLVGKKLFEEATSAVNKSIVTLTREKKISDCHVTAFHPGSIDYTPQHQIIHALMEAMEKHKICKLTYQALEAPRPKTYHIKPMQLFAYRDAIYLHAHKAKEPGKPYQSHAFAPLIAIHRIKTLEITDMRFQPEKFDFDKIFNRHFGIMKENAFAVEAEFTGWAAKYVVERVWSSDQEIIAKGKGKIILKFTASSEPELISWLLSFAEEAKLIKPGHLIAKLTDIAEAILKNYKEQKKQE